MAHSHSIREYAQVLLAPFLMRLLVAMLVPLTSPAASDSHSFAFLYGMLPSAPTIVVFAREYGERSDMLAALQLLCLSLAVPFLLGSTLAIESPRSAEPIGLMQLSYWVAILGVASAALVALFLLFTGRRALTTRPQGWLLGIAAASLTFSLTEVLGRALGCLQLALDTGLRATSAWALAAMRTQLAFLAMYMAVQSRHSGTRSASTPASTRIFRSWHVIGVVLTLVVSAVVEGVGVFLYPPSRVAPSPPVLMLPDASPPSVLTAGEWLCSGHSLEALRGWYIGYTALSCVIITASLAIVFLAQSDPPGCGVAGGVSVGSVHATASLVDQSTSSIGVSVGSQSTADRDSLAGGGPALRRADLRTNESCESLGSLARVESTDSLLRFDIPSLGDRPPGLPQETPPAAARSVVTHGHTPLVSCVPLTSHVCSSPGCETRPCSHHSQASTQTGTSSQVSHRLLRQLVASSTERLPRQPREHMMAARQARLGVPLINRWRTRLSLLLLYAAISMLVSIITIVTSALQTEDSIFLVMLLIDRILIFCHGLALFALFGGTEEVAGPITTAVRRQLAACLVGIPEAPITAFPRSESGFWG